MLDDDDRKAAERLLTGQAQHELLQRLSQRVSNVWDLHRGSPADLRELGLEVAAHNDYRLNGERFTFWLMTYTPPAEWKRPAYAFKGEGRTDAEALDRIRARFAELTDDHHHAPACPANHYHGRRAPTGRCTDGFIGRLAQPR